ncbi:MAG: glycosyltransferase family 2 protein, partial [Victivallales bacterium]|nr:glycosyltransferase family 2 protein [Victivallales bacterium]
MEKTFFIIPVYKVENTLDRCVESVLRQSEGDYEVVLVDDGSPDGAGRRCDEWAVLDPRIHALHRKNGGLGAARNTGIEYVLSRTGTGWLTFLDSD